MNVSKKHLDKMQKCVLTAIGGLHVYPDEHTKEGYEAANLRTEQKLMHLSGYISALTDMVEK